MGERHATVLIIDSSKQRDCKLSTIKGCFNLYLSSFLCRKCVCIEIKVSNVSSLEFTLNGVKHSERQKINTNKNHCRGINLLGRLNGETI